MAEMPNSEAKFTLRDSKPGDIGLIISRHGILYNQEYGWDTRFESLVARICADFVDTYDASSDRLWIAEDSIDSSFLGCIMLVRDRKMSSTAKLRLLLVEPNARGLGLGARLIQECIDFARGVGYERVELWTQSCLFSARRLYQKVGFRLIREEPHESFGAKMVAESWELSLQGRENASA